MLKAMLSPITRPSSSHKVTFRCRDHDNLAREIVLVLVQAWDQQLCKRLPKKSKKGILVQYCTVRYSTVLSECPLRFVLSHSPPLPSTSLSPVVVTAEDFRRRIKMSDRVAGINMAISDSVTCSCAELFCSKAHLLESIVTQRTLATSLKRRRQWSKGHCMEK